MNKLRKNELVILFSLFFFHIDAFAPNEVLLSFKETLQLDLQDFTYQGLKNVFFKTIALNESNITIKSLFPNNIFCNYLKNFSFNKAEKTDSVYEFLFVQKEYECNDINISRTMENFLIKTRTEGNLLNIRAAIFAGVYFPHVYNADYKFFCNKLYNFIAEDGAAQPYLYSQRSRFSSIREENFQTISSLFYWILKLNPSLVSNEKLLQFASYLKSSRNYPTSPEEVLNFYRVARKLSNIPLLIIHKNLGDTDGGLIITIEFDNLFREPFSDISDFQLNADLFYRNSVIERNLYVNKEKNRFKVYIGAELVANHNEYELRIKYDRNNTTFEHRENILIKDKLQIDYLRLAVSDSFYPPVYLKKELVYKQMLTGTIQANETNFLNIEFKLTQNTHKADLIAIRFSHQNLRHNSETLIMKYDHKTSLWKTVFDFKKLDKKVLVVNGTYELELVISGNLIHPIIWTFAEFNITYFQSLNNVQNRIFESYPLLEAKDTQFEAPKKKPFVLLTGFFNMLILSALGVFFIFLKNLNVSVDIDAKNILKKLILLIIIILITGSIYLGIKFSTKITVFEALFILLLFVMPIIMIGNLALTAIK